MTHTIIDNVKWKFNVITPIANRAATLLYDKVFELDPR